MGRFDPFLNDDLRLSEGFLPGEAICRAARKFGHLCNECLIFFTPIKDDLVFTHLLRPDGISG